MFNLLSVILAFSFGCGSFAQSNTETTSVQTPERIFERAIQSIGGRKSLNKITSFQLHGVMRLPDGKPAVEIDLATKEGGKVLGVLTYLGVGQSRFGSDGSTAWEQNLNGQNEATWEIISDQALSTKVRQTNWLEWFTTLPTTLHTTKFLGEEVFDGENCWKLRINPDDSNTEIAFFSTATHHPRGRRTTERTNAGDITLDVYFRSWEHVGKLLLFHEIVFSQGKDNEVIFKIDRIVLDTAKNSLFELPEQITALKEEEEEEEEE